MYKIKELIEMAKIVKSSYYYYIKNKNRLDKYKDIKEKISYIFHKNKGRYGYRRITMTLKNEGLIINHKTVRRLMKIIGLKCLVRVKKYKSYKVAKNI
jgi:putative transposase